MYRRDLRNKGLVGKTAIYYEFGGCFDNVFFS